LQQSDEHNDEDYDQQEMDDRSEMNWEQPEQQPDDKDNQNDAFQTIPPHERILQFRASMTDGFCLPGRWMLISGTIPGDNIHNAKRVPAARICWR
jgi:hypothetical protein